MSAPSPAPDDDFSVLVLASDLGVDARPFLSPTAADDNWHDCAADFADGDFSDLESLQFLRVNGSDVNGNRILRFVGKCFPAQVVGAERLKKYVFYKIYSELPEGPFCIVYMHTTVQKEDNSPGMTILRWVYEDLPSDIKERLQVVYFLHPGLRSRIVFATLGRFFLSGNSTEWARYRSSADAGESSTCEQLESTGKEKQEKDTLLYWKVKYVSRLQYLWDDIKKEEIEIPDFVKKHDDILEHRPLTDYGIEPDPLHLTEVSPSAYSSARYEERWVSREFMS